MNIKVITKISLIAAVYASLTIGLAPISYNFVQFRVSEALTVLPFFMPESIWGLFIGCALANIYSGLGIYDIVFGSLASLAAAFLTSKMPSRWLAPLPPVVVNAIVIGFMWSYFSDMPFYLTASYVAIGQIGACYFLGLPLLFFLEKSVLFKRLRGNENA
ncbi:MAG: QueT transporter family protein [Clostridia bacterium]|nr:QueT transporter family protein [Clostridia bacterium]